VSSLDSVAEDDLSEVRLLTVAEVANRVRQSKIMVYRPIHADALPALESVGSHRISQVALTRLVQGSRRKFPSIETQVRQPDDDDPWARWIPDPSDKSFTKTVRRLRCMFRRHDWRRKYDYTAEQTISDCRRCGFRKVTPWKERPGGSH